MTVGNIKTALEEDRRSKNRLDSDFTMALGLKAYIDIMDFYGLENFTQINEQQLPKTERKGFTLVEWGGSDVSSKIKNNEL